MTVGVLLLAAGQSRRFGADKRCAVLQNGNTVLGTSISAIQRAALPLCVAVPADDPKGLIPETEAVEVLRCHKCGNGIGATIAEAIPQLPPWDACLIALGDMPFVTPETFRRVAGQAMEDRIVVPTYQDKPGHPVAFGSDFYTALALLSSDRGAKTVIDNHRDSLLTLPTTDAGILRDIDTPADLN